MSDHVTLLGTEQVQTAGRTIHHAAEEIRRAAETISSAFREHQQFMDNWLISLSGIMEKNK